MGPHRYASLMRPRHLISNKPFELFFPCAKMGYHEKTAVELIILKGGKQSKKTTLNLVEICVYAKHNRWISLLAFWRYETICAVNKFVWLKIFFCFSEPVLVECQAQKRIGPLFIDRQHQYLWNLCLCQAQPLNFTASCLMVWNILCRQQNCLICCFSQLVLAECQAQKRIELFFIDRQHQYLYSTFSWTTPSLIDLSKTTADTEIPPLNLVRLWLQEENLQIMALPKYVIALKIFAIAVNFAFSTDLDGICPVPLQQNPNIPWIGHLDPNKTMFAPTGDVNIGRLPNSAFVQSPNLEVCVLHIYKYETNNNILQLMWLFLYK